MAELVIHCLIENEVESRKNETNASKEDTIVAKAEVRGDKEETVIEGSFSRPTQSLPLKTRILSITGFSALFCSPLFVWAFFREFRQFKVLPEFSCRLIRDACFTVSLSTEFSTLLSSFHLLQLYFVPFHSYPRHDVTLRYSFHILPRPSSDIYRVFSNVTFSSYLWFNGFLCSNERYLTYESGQ